MLTGPKIRAGSLAELREPVVRHLLTAGYLMPDEEPDVLVLRPSDLRLVPPAAVIRSLDDPALWLPAVEGTSAEGPVVGLLAQPAELATEARRRRGSPAWPHPPPPPTSPRCLRYIGHEMTVRGRLVDPWTLYATEVRPEIWARTEELTDGTDRALTAHLVGGPPLEVPVRHTAAGEAVGAISDQGIAVFLAGDHDALGDRDRALPRWPPASCAIPPTCARRWSAQAPPERLDPDSIWTGRRRLRRRARARSFQSQRQPTKTWRSKPHDRRPDRRGLGDRSPRS